MRRKSNRWQRLSTVTGSLSTSVVANRNFTCGGGSSSVLSKRVERLLREHVHFVDDVDLVARADRGIAHRLDDLAHVVDAGVAGGVHLDHVDMAALGDRTARLAHAARVDRRAALPVRPDAVERLGDQPRGAGLADPAHAGHQEGMRQPLALDGVGQRLDHRVLADQLARRSAGGTCGRERDRAARPARARLSVAKRSVRASPPPAHRTSPIVPPLRARPRSA